MATWHTGFVHPVLLYSELKVKTREDWAGLLSQTQLTRTQKDIEDAAHLLIFNDKFVFWN
jgi:hypothetical protein